MPFKPTQESLKRLRTRLTAATHRHLADVAAHEVGAAEAAANRLFGSIHPSSGHEDDLHEHADEVIPADFKIGMVGGIVYTTPDEKIVAEAFSLDSKSGKTERTIPLSQQYSAPPVRGPHGELIRAGGDQFFHDLLDGSHKGSAYFPTRIQTKILKQNPDNVAGKHYIEFGQARGENPQLITQLNGFWDLSSFIDIVPEYLAANKAGLVALGYDPSTIFNYKKDFMTPEFFTETMPSIFGMSAGRANTVRCYGNTLNNDSLPIFLSSLRPHLTIGKDDVHLGLDSSWSENLLIQAYMELKPWLMNGMGFVIDKKLNLEGFDSRNFMWSPYVTTEGECCTVHFRMISLVRQELFQRSLIDMAETPAQLKARLGTPTLVIEKGETIDLGCSKRYTRDAYLAIFAAAGYAAHNPREHLIGRPLGFKDKSEDQGIDYKVWRLIPV